MTTSQTCKSSTSSDRGPRYKALPAVWRDREQVESGLRMKIRQVLGGLSPWPFVMFGEAGSGKTCAALCMLDHLGGGFYTTAGELCSMLIAAQQGKLTWKSGYARTETEIWSAWEQTPIAVLDEIGARSVSDFHYEQVKRALDSRQGSPFVVVSNLVDLNAISECYDDRIASRLSAGTIVSLKGDRRGSVTIGEVEPVT